MTINHRIGFDVDGDSTDLYSVLPSDKWEGFSYADYRNGEQKILKPALEKLGYYNIAFYMGEQDSFGPLSRVVFAYKDGVRFTFIYG
jgi:hypothetical protein